MCYHQGFSRSEIEIAFVERENVNNWPLKVVTVWEGNLKLRGDIPPKALK